ncbi:MAG: hypothetical protein ACLRMJ_03765 [Alistipes finegoldii]
MNHMEIEVLGTTFDARYERASASPDHAQQRPICVRTSRSSPSGRPDERLVFNETSGSMIIEQVNASNYNSWIQPTLTFFDDARRHHHQPRTLVQRSIGTDASVDAPSVCRSTSATNRRRDLQVISLITGLQYTLDGESATFPPHEPPDQDNLKNRKPMGIPPP